MTLQVNGRAVTYEERDPYSDRELLPEHMRDGMKRYLENGILPGSFMEAVLCNDLMGAMGRADDINRHRIFDICSWLYNYAPAGSYGSPDAVRNWISKGNGNAD